MPNSLFSDEYSSLTALLVGARRAAGLTQVELADRLGRPQSYVSKYERGERRLDIVEYTQIVEAMSGDPIQLFSDLYRMWKTRA